MRIKFLLPHHFKRVGWFIAIPALILMIMNLHNDFTFSFLNYQAKDIHKISFDNGLLFNIQYNNFTDEIGSVLLIGGLLMIALSKEKIEDERIAHVRLESLLWAVLLNSLLLIVSIIFFYDGLFLKIMAYNICTPLILFICRFNLLMYVEKKNLKRKSQ
jgi:hypothetical protein